MVPALTGSAILDREFLELRAKILELAASLDRLSRAGGAAESDPRPGELREAIGVLLEDRPDRAARVQLVFSLPYDSGWRRALGLMPAE